MVLKIAGAGLCPSSYALRTIRRPSMPPCPLISVKRPTGPPLTAETF